MRIVIVDFSWVYYRAMFAFKNFSVPTAQGELCTGGMFGSVRDIASLCNKFDEVIVCLEPVSNDRRDLLEEYKQGRTHVDMSLFDETLSAITNFGGKVKIVSSPESGEADDVIYSVAKYYANVFEEIVVYSADRDLLQLGAIEAIRDKVYFSNAADFCVLMADYCERKYGVPVEKWMLWKSIKGDGSDGVPAVVKRHQSKKIVALLNKIHSPEDILTMESDDRLVVELKLKYLEWVRNVKLVQLRDLPVANVILQYKPVEYFVKTYSMNSFYRFFGKI